MSGRERLVVVGNGMAGIRCLEEALKLGAGDRFAITVFGDEPHPNYDRIRLSPLLAGEAGWDDIVLNDRAWYERHGVTLHTGCLVTSIDRGAREVVDDRGRRTPYDKLILATGSRAFVLPIPGHDKAGVVPFRTIADCRQMTEAAQTHRRAAVIGGGLLGLEAARGLSVLGMEVTVVHLMGHLMERQLDATGGAYLARAIRAQGIEVRLSTRTTEILGGERVTGLRFADGSTLDADLVVMAVGIRPRVDVAQAAGLEIARGIVVDDHLRTSDPAVYAVGECAEHRGQLYGLVAPLYEQGRVLARHLVGEPGPGYEGSSVATRLKVSGVDVFSAGDPHADERCEVLRLERPSDGVYKKLLLDQDRVVGAVLVGDLARASQVERYLRGGQVVNGQRYALLEDASAVAEPVDEDVAACAGDAIICGCNGVDKATICEAIDAHELATVAAVAAHTNAARSCGGCSGQVEALLRLHHGADALEPVVEAICGCTTHTREEVVAAIRERRLLSVVEVLEALDWDGEGCATCRPALNYYVVMCWPGEAKDDPASRFVNERVHANVQRDGTFSVVPRIYGGLTTPDELIRIGAVAKRYDVPTVKITGGARIDLLGIEKDDLPRVWEALDMPSGFAYAKGVRTVKTCVGDQYCRFGTRDSMGFGVRLERTFQNLWMPHKVKMAVNACPRNCAEALIKDVGLIGVEQGWEIYVGGNGGLHVRVAELLCTEPDDDEAVRIIAAFLQLYREECPYAKRTSWWCEAVGLDAIRARVVDDLDERAALAGRMDEAIRHRPQPWRERVERLHASDGRYAREFLPLHVTEEGAA